MPAVTRYGMDQEYTDWSPIVKRGVLKWPDGARVALCVVVYLEHYEWNPPEGSFHSPTLASPMWVIPYPDFHTTTHREYGHRVGIFRVMEVLDKYGIKATVAMDALTAENYPTLVRECQQREYEIMAHGVGIRRMITSNMSEAEERQYIRQSIDTLATATGKKPAGWLGPEYGESERTPRLLAEMGIQYTCDWGNDEQPYSMTTPAGELYALPILSELDDVAMSFNRRVAINEWSDLIKLSFDVQYLEGAKNGRLVVVSVHPWCLGQPHRIKYLDQALGHMLSHSGVWKATGSEIVDWYSKNRPSMYEGARP
jgi:allantoinase